MEKIDLGEDLSSGIPEKTPKNEKYYPSFSFEDEGMNGEPRFKTEDLEKTTKVEMDITLKSVSSALHTEGETFEYRFEIRNLYLK
jgi:hypothetical protein